MTNWGRSRWLIALVAWQITNCGSEQLPGEAMESQTEEGSFKPSHSIQNQGHSQVPKVEDFFLLLLTCEKKIQESYDVWF